MPPANRWPLWMGIASALLLPGLARASEEPAGTALVEVDLIDLDDGSIRADHVVLLRRGEIEGVFPITISAVPQGYEVIAAPDLYLLPAYVDLSINLDLVADEEGEPAAATMAGDLYRSGILVTVVPGSPMDSVRAAADSLLRIPCGPILDARAGARGIDPPAHVALLNEQVPIPAQIRYIVPYESPLLVLGANVSGSMARRVTQVALGQGLMVMTPAANSAAGTWDMIESGAPVLEGLGLVVLGHHLNGGFSQLYGEDEMPWMASGLRESPTAPHILSAVLGKFDDDALDSAAGRTPDAARAFAERNRPRLICPQLTLLEGLLAVRGYNGGLMDSVLVLVKSLQDMGAPLAVGTGGLGAEAFFREIELLMEAGVPALQIVRAAAVEGAVALGRPDPSHLRAGLPADLVVIEGNPLEDPRALREIRYVIRGGKVLAVGAGGG